MEKYFITKSKVVKAVASVIYDFAPGNNPRGIIKIMRHVRLWCSKNFKDYDKWTKAEINANFTKMLYTCKEFTQLNISQALWDNGVRDYNDSKNQGVSFTSVGHDEDGEPCVITKTKEYYDFVDLDACINNIIREYILDIENNEDCFLCKYAEEYQSFEPSNCEKCRTCTLHPEHRCNYEPHPTSLVLHK